MKSLFLCPLCSLWLMFFRDLSRNLENNIGFLLRFIQSENLMPSPGFFFSHKGRKEHKGKKDLCGLFAFSPVEVLTPRLYGNTALSCGW